MTIKDRFWKWMKDTYQVGLVEASVKSMDISPYWNYFLATQLSPEERKGIDTRAPTPTGEEGRPMTQWPYEKTEKRQAYEDYRAAGGPLDYYAWLEAGEPTALEVGAANEWLEYYLLSLQAQIDSGAIS